MSVYYKDIEEAALKEFESVSSAEALEAFRIKYLGRNGIVAGLFEKLATFPKEERQEAGKALNVLKNTLSGLVDAQRSVLAKQTVGQAAPLFDVTLPGTAPTMGHRHLLTTVIDEICRIFMGLGFRLYEGSELETEHNNFQALNISLDHPSRDAFDTFYLDTSCSPRTKKTPLLLRSHTSPGQVRVMTHYEPPVAAIVPGKVYRPDATDASHSFMFHQVEGFLVDRGIKFSDLKGILEAFSREMFWEKTRIRFRPHFFPFTEPSAEVDVSCIICGGEPASAFASARSRRRPPRIVADGGSQHKHSHTKACSVCKGKGWLEILGCGMIHPNVFAAVNYPKDAFTGFAFGMGVERIAMLRYGIDDIRIFFENDARFLRQF